MAADRKLGEELAEDVAVLSDDDIRRQNEEQESGEGGGGSYGLGGTGCDRLAHSTAAHSARDIRTATGSRAAAPRSSNPGGRTGLVERLMSV